MMLDIQNMNFVVTHIFGKDNHCADKLATVLMASPSIALFGGMLFLVLSGKTFSVIGLVFFFIDLDDPCKAIFHVFGSRHHVFLYSFFIFI